MFALENTKEATHASGFLSCAGVQAIAFYRVEENNNQGWQCWPINEVMSMITKTKEATYLSTMISNKHGIDTEYRFDNQEERKMFMIGYNRGLSQSEPLSHTKPYRLGYQVGSNER